jgi:hypothetical protein
MSPAGRFFFARLFPWIFVVIGGIALYFGVESLVRARASLAWPRVEGKILSSKVERHESTGNKGKRRTTYGAKVLYEYSLDKNIYHGSRVAYGDYSSSDPGHAQGIVNRYPPVSTVHVYYMPNDPSVSLLEPGVKAQAWFLPVFGLVFFCVGNLLALLLPRLLRKPAQTGDSDAGAAAETA